MAVLQSPVPMVKVVFVKKRGGLAMRWSKWSSSKKTWTRQSENCHMKVQVDLVMNRLILIIFPFQTLGKAGCRGTFPTIGEFRLGTWVFAHCLL